MQYKAYSYEKIPGKWKEIRRFSVPDDVSSNFEYLHSKVASIFSNLGDRFSLQWQDLEGDMIWFNSDDELLQALSFHTPGDVFKLFVQENSTKLGRKKRCDDESQAHPFDWGSSFGRFNHSNYFQHPFAWNGHSTFGQPPAGYGCPMRNASARCQSASPPEEPQGKKEPTSEKHEEKESSQTQPSPGMDYLQRMGNTVANFLQPLGIDVDVSVEHNGERSKCTGTQTSQPHSTPRQTHSSPPPNMEPQNEEQEGLSDPEWTLVKTDDERMEAQTAPKSPSAPPHSTETDENNRLHSALNQLEAMGFKADDWLVGLLKSCDYDIQKAIELMQPDGGFRA